MEKSEITLLRNLSHQYPNVASAATEIINLQSILNLPKGTEHFITDIHGEYEQFNHILKNGSGSVRRKIDEEFGNTISNRDKKSLATLIYYPEEKLEIVKRSEENLEDFYKITLHRLVQVTKRVSSKYTRSKVRKALPKDFAYVMPPSVRKNEEAKKIYEETMAAITKACSELEANCGIPREDAAMLLPLGMCTKIVDKRNVRNLIDMSHQRLCTRAYWEYRQLMHDLMDALREYSEEWAYLVDNYFVPKCDVAGYCTEAKCCGRKPYKEV